MGALQYILRHLAEQNMIVDVVVSLYTNIQWAIGFKQLYSVWYTPIHSKLDGLQMMSYHSCFCVN